MPRRARPFLLCALLSLAAPAARAQPASPLLTWRDERTGEPSLRADWYRYALRYGGAAARPHFAQGEAQALRALDSLARHLEGELVAPDGALRGDATHWIAASLLFDELGAGQYLAAQESSERAATAGTLEPPEPVLDLRCALAAEYHLLTALPAGPHTPQLAYYFAWSLGEMAEPALAAAAWRALVCPAHFSLPATLEVQSLGAATLPEPTCPALAAALTSAAPRPASQGAVSAEQYLRCPGAPAADRTRALEAWFRLGELHFEGTDATQQLQELPLAAAAYRQVLRSANEDPAWLDAALAQDAARAVTPAAASTLRVTALPGGTVQQPQTFVVLARADAQGPSPSMTAQLTALALYKLGSSYHRAGSSPHASAACFARLLSHPPQGAVATLAHDALSYLAALHADDAGPAPPEPFSRACQRVLASATPVRCDALYRLLGDTLGGALAAPRARRGAPSPSHVPLLAGEHPWTPALWAELARLLYESDRAVEARWLDALLLQRYPRFEGADAVRARRETPAQN